MLKRLNCHPATLHYREKRGQITGIKISGKKFFRAEDVEQLLKHNPVHPKPHWSRRSAKQTKQSLWSKIKSLFASVAK